MPKLDLDTIPQTNTTDYPPQFAGVVAGRWNRRLAPVGGLTHMGASHVVLKPGAQSSQRHWHDGEDEFVVILSGEAVLIDDSGEHPMHAGDCAAFPGDERNGHVLVNRSDTDCTFIAVSAGPDLGGGYSDIDMLFTADGRYTTKHGVEYPPVRAR